MTDVPRYVALINEYLRERDVKIGQAAAGAGVNVNSAPTWVRESKPAKFPPLVGMVKLAAWLEIPPEEFFAAVLDVQFAEGRTLAERVAELEATVEQLDEVRLAREARLRAEQTLRGQIGAADAEAQGRRGRGDAPAREQ